MAYRLLGTVSKAEEAVQEAWLRVHRTPMDEVDDVGAWLSVVTTRICYDVLKSARVRRERYVGEWLPEPVVDDGASVRGREGDVVPAVVVDRVDVDGELPCDVALGEHHQ